MLPLEVTLAVALPCLNLLLSKVSVAAFVLTHVAMAAFLLLVIWPIVLRRRKRNKFFLVLAVTSALLHMAVYQFQVVGVGDFPKTVSSRENAVLVGCFIAAVACGVRTRQGARRALRTEYTAQNLLASKFTVKLFLAPFHDRFVGEKIVRDETDSAGIRKGFSSCLF